MSMPPILNEPRHRKHTVTFKTTTSEPGLVISTGFTCSPGMSTATEAVLTSASLCYPGSHRARAGTGTTEAAVLQYCKYCK